MSVPNLAFFERALHTQAPSDPIELMQTHISIVGLTTHQAFKMKKPVRFGFVDFSTVEKRNASCDEELKLNRRYSQHVYLEKLSLRRTPDGACKFSNHAQDGEIVDWVIKMRRLPEELTVQNLIQSGKFSSAYQQRLFDTLDLIVKGDSPIVLTPDAYQRELTAHVSDNQRELRQLVSARECDVVDSIHDSLYRFIVLHPELWQQRVCDGRVVHGHGDLRPCHIYLTPIPAIIDCVEFSRDLRTLDLLDEFCFLLMELDRLQAPQLADQVLSWYRNSSGDKASDSLVAFYKCYRAVVRWKIEFLQAASAGQDYRALAERYRESLDPRRLIVVSGLSGSGKTVLTTALAERLRCLDLHTDIVRRENSDRPRDLEAAPDQDYAGGKYSGKQRAENYQRMLARAAEAFAMHRCIILDGTFSRQCDREAAEQLAVKSATQRLLLWCTCPENVRKARIEERLATSRDVSEIYPDHLRRQAAEAEYPANDYLKVDTMASLPDQLELICRNLSQDPELQTGAQHGQTSTNTQAQVGDAQAGDGRNRRGLRESHVVPTPSTQR